MLGIKDVQAKVLKRRLAMSFSVAGAAILSELRHVLQSVVLEAWSDIILLRDRKSRLYSY